MDIHLDSDVFGVGDTRGPDEPPWCEMRNETEQHSDLEAWHKIWPGPSTFDGPRSGQSTSVQVRSKMGQVVKVRVHPHKVLGLLEMAKGPKCPPNSWVLPNVGLRPPKQILTPPQWKHNQSRARAGVQIHNRKNTTPTCFGEVSN